MISLKLQTARFNSAIQEYAKHVKKDAAHVVNRQSLNVMIKAIQNSPVASEKKILAGFGYSGMGDIQKYRRTKKGKVVKSGKPKVVRKFSKPLAYKIVNKKSQKKLSRFEVGKAASVMLGKRIAAISYVKAGWIQPANHFAALKTGLKLTAAMKKPLKKFSRIKWSASTAKDGEKPWATFGHWSSAAGTVGKKVLAKALGLAATDMRDYIQKKYKGTARQFCKIVR